LRVAGAIDVYGGDFFAASRSEWDPETLLEQPFDMEKKLAIVRTGERPSRLANLLTARGATRNRRDSPRSGRSYS
jgi:hypothetical protein